MSSADATAFAVIHPDGDITWYPLRAEQEVEAIVAGKYAGAVDRAFLIPGEPLRLIASDIALAAPDDFAPNPAAQRIITALSGGRITQPWRGHVAITEYDRDPGTREWLWPTVMSEQAQQRIREAAERMPVGLNCPGCGEPPAMVMGGGTQAFCGTDDCPFFTWDPTLTLAELNADAGVIDLGGWETT